MSFVTSVARRAANKLLPLAPIPFWRRLFPKAELGVCYHIVSDAAVPHVRHYHVLDTAQFEADLTYLQRNFGFVTYEELVRRRSAGAIRDNAVMLTFDDGFAECASVVAPLLSRRGVSCVFFVITDLIDNKVLFRESGASLCITEILRSPVERIQAIVADMDLGDRLATQAGVASSDPTVLPLEIADLGQAPDERLIPLLQWLLNLPAADAGLLQQLQARLGIDPERYLHSVQPYLTSQQIRQLHADGFTIGAHSRSHRRLQGLPRSEAEAEIVDSCRIIREITGQSSVPFAFPYFGGDLDRAWLEGLREQHDFVGLMFDTDGLREDEPFVVQRVFGERFGPDRTMDSILRRAWSRRLAWRKRA